MTDHKPKIGVALGGGGARGLSHIPLLEVLEDMGVRPSFVTGTSIGAIVGSLYCAGIPPAELRETLREIGIGGEMGFRKMIVEGAVLKWLEFAMPQFSGGGFLGAGKVLDYLFERIEGRTFEDLDIPLKVVAADFWRREQVVLDTGDVRDAVHASMAVPGVFAPVKRDGKLLIDGGVVNPVPFDLLPDDCDITIAVDVTGRRTAGPQDTPNLTDVMFNTFHIAEKTITREKLNRCKPDILIEPDLPDVRLLEFYRAKEIFSMARTAQDQLRRELENALAR